MAEATVSRWVADAGLTAERRHRLRIALVWIGLGGVIIATLAYGFDYYMLDRAGRVLSEKHVALRPGGSLGTRLGILGTILFLCLYLYPIRKRSKFLQRIGKTKHWLDFHVILGTTAPIIITLHSSFKFRGVAGVAYWLMMAVMWSGLVGRYFYAQIPRSMSTTALTFADLGELCEGTRQQIEAQHLVSREELEEILTSDLPENIHEMSLTRTLLTMIWLDFLRPLRSAKLRRRFLTGTEKWKTVGGLMSSSKPEVEEVVRLVRRQSWLQAKMAFLDKANQIFQLWHVVHRPFSYSFAVLAVMHIVVVVMMGYY